MFDTTRGWTTSGGVQRLQASSSAAEGADTTQPAPKVSGISGANTSGFGVSQTYIYCAIRRPNKPPTSGTQVYNAITRTGTSAAATVTGVGFAPDSAWSRGRAGPNINYYSYCPVDRLRGVNSIISTSSTGYESGAGGTQVISLDMDGMSVGTDNQGYLNNSASATYINHFFRRAP